MAQNNVIPSERARAYIYRVLVALAPILVAYGYLDEQSIALWLGVASTVLGIGLAAVNTSTDDGRHEGPYTGQ